jgi:hypothetical protein
VFESDHQSVRFDCPFHQCYIFNARQSAFRALMDEDRSTRLVEGVVDLILMEKGFARIAVVATERYVVDGLSEELGRGGLENGLLVDNSSAFLIALSGGIVDGFWLNVWLSQ